MRRPEHLVAAGKAAWGFTLVELLVVVSILGVIAAYAGPNISSSLRASRVRQTANMLAADMEKSRAAAFSLRAPVLFSSYTGTPDNWVGDTDAAVTLSSSLQITGTARQRLTGARPSWISGSLASFTPSASPVGQLTLIESQKISPLIGVLPSVRLSGIVFWPDGRVTNTANVIQPQISFRVCSEDGPSLPYNVTIRQSGSIIISPVATGAATC